MNLSLEDLVQRARRAEPNERIDLRDPIAAHGRPAVDEMAEWLADPVLTRFAVRVIGKVADGPEHEAAVTALQEARLYATPNQAADIDAELRRLGTGPDASARRGGRTQRGGPVDPSVPGWMMRTNRELTQWLWSEVRAGRLRQGWGSQPKQDLTLLRDRRERGEPFDTDDENAWPNRRMLTDEPDGMQINDIVFLPHLPRESRWSVVRITGPYRYEIAEGRNDYGHILPVEILESDFADDDLNEELRWVRTYPARLRRLTRQAYDDLRRFTGT